MVKINKKNYYTTNEENGEIYTIGFDGEIGEEVGKYINSKPTFYKK
jgi:hypothetical protein